MTLLPTRRAALGFLASAAAGAALPLARSAPAAAQFGPSPFDAPAAVPAGLRFGTVSADTSRIARLGNPVGAQILQRDLDRQLRVVFADLMGGGSRGAALLVRVNSLYLGLYTGGRAGSGQGIGPDNIDGVGLVSSGGRVLSQTPIYTTLDPSYSGAWYLPDIDRRRIDSISYQLAYWLRREMGI
ncbi:hypothetical protein D3273_01610 [Lichenibacterium minor]|uniref:Uncharacterized protein n=1 Tax=Lichenibacterium minor TaxID=2316528 RepID=A0A4Q2UBJ2_9HYPH|nr:hypothetical protein [Lichenibacterium minor]RYC33972.1 hypothetical protein D3273_01610 [Lichenibacterium minor]